MNNQLKKKPDLEFWKLWNLSFGFFGVQIAYALQSANISRIFATLGADPHNLSYFWITYPLSFRGRLNSCASDVPTAQRRFVWHDSQYGHDFRTRGLDVSRYKYQYGHATL